MKLRIIFLSIFLFAILLSGCNNQPGNSPIVAGDLVGECICSLYHPVQTFINENLANLEGFWIDVFGEANRQVTSFYFEAGGGNELIVTFYLLEGFYEFYELWEPEMNFQLGISSWWDEFDVIIDEIVAIQESMGWSYFVYTLRFEESTGSLITCGFDSGGLFFLDISLQ